MMKPGGQEVSTTEYREPLEAVRISTMQAADIYEIAMGVRQSDEIVQNSTFTTVQINGELLPELQAFKP